MRKRGITAANAGNPGKDVAEVAVFRGLLHLGARIGDGDEMAADFLFADFLTDALVEILLEDVGLEHVKLWVARKFAESEAQNFYAKAGAAHAEKDRVAEFCFLDFGRELFEVGEFLELLIDDGEPAEPFAFVGAGPEGRVLLPEARYLVIRFPVGERGLHSFGQGWGQLVGDFV